MDGAVVPIQDPVIRRLLRRQARGIWIGATVSAIMATVLVVIFH